MYTATPPTLGISSATLHFFTITLRAWGTMPEAERLKMHAFTPPSKQLRLKVRHALLSSLHYTSLY